jgi:SAM-dependent methyltransferase
MLGDKPPEPPVADDAVDRVRTIWQNLADRDPMWAVLSDPDKSRRRWDEAEFFATGEQHVASFMEDLDARGLVPERQRCLDFGCGLGRLTQPLADHFERADGVDVAGSMIDGARAHNRRGDRCVFHLNEAPDLALFADDTFDMVFSFIVLQHIPSELTLRYLAEFVRVTKPGGLLVFQLPAEPRPAVAAEPLPEVAFRARIELTGAPPEHVAPGREVALLIEVTNEGPVIWPAHVEGPGPFHVRVGNHWRSPRGRMRIADDGRVALPRDVEPGQSVAVRLNVTAPAESGVHLLEVDLVQEEVAWFAERGSSPGVATVKVLPTPAGVVRAATRLPVSVLRRIPIVRRWARALLARSRRPAPVGAKEFEISEDEMFDMNGVPRDEVVELLRTAGADVVDSGEDGCAGAHWLSYTYYAVKRP